MSNINILNTVEKNIIENNIKELKKSIKLDFTIEDVEELFSLVLRKNVKYEYVETEDPDAAPGEGAGSLGYITLKFKELPSDIGLLELMVYCRGFYIGTPWNDQREVI